MPWWIETLRGASHALHYHSSSSPHSSPSVCTDPYTPWRIGVTWWSNIFSHIHNSSHNTIPYHFHHLFQQKFSVLRKGKKKKKRRKKKKGENSRPVRPIDSAPTPIDSPCPILFIYYTSSSNWSRNNRVHPPFSHTHFKPSNVLLRPSSYF